MRQARAEIERPNAFVAPTRATRVALRARARPDRNLRALASAGFGYFAAASDVAAIVFAAFVSNSLFGLMTFGYVPNAGGVTPIGAVVALLVVLTTAQRGEYDMKHYAARSGHFARAFPVWNLALLIALALGFATRTLQDFSRGSAGVFYVAGFLALVLARRGVVEFAASLRRKGLASPRRMIVVGFEERLAEVLRPGDAEVDGVEIVSVIALRDNQAYFADDLALAAAAVRMYRPDDVRIAIPWSRAELLEACTEAFLLTPAEIHLAADDVLERFGEAKVAQIGGLLGLQVTRAPYSWMKRMEKRAFDVALASLAVIALSPVLALVALLIRIDSPGPALFRQKRYGFNQEPFRIYKFRSMSTQEDGRHVAQATRGDPRVTKIGRFIRRTSIDELPQLLNVIRGEMSIVGPRPHALAHDQRYVERLARYARRHNVKPGITGWAQVQGYRGEIANDQEMQNRLEHDLHYVDNWSLWLDIKIVWMTVFSKSARRNAY
jgi:Undecaprenyl-phosphate glucose phosphotransferase